MSPNPIPSPLKAEVAATLRIPNDLHEALKAEARRQDRSLAWVIRGAIRAYLAARATNKSLTTVEKGNLVVSPASLGGQS